MRMSTYGIPRIIWSLDETDEYIGIPRGCKSSFISLLKDVNLECVYEDKRTPIILTQRKAYFQIGYKALASKEEPDKINMIYDSDTFRSAMRKDVEDSKKEILIVCPYVRKKQINLIFDLLKDPLGREILIKILTLPIKSYKEQELARKNIEILQTAVNVTFQADIYQKYIIIDNRLVWYGSIGLLDYRNADDTIMRLESRELAVELRTESVIE